MLDFEDLQLIRALNQNGSLAAAARALNITPPAVSLRLKRMENSLGVRLVLRTARASSFTDEGLRLRDEAVALLDRLESVSEVVTDSAAALAGHLRIGAPFGFGRHHVAPLISSFCSKYPEIIANLTLSEKPLAETTGVDLVFHIGEIKDSSLIRHVLAPNERFVCASPEYLHLHGVPQHPSELSNRKCLCLRENNESVALWRFFSAHVNRVRPNARQSMQVKVTPFMSSNNGEVISQWTQEGMGLMVRSEWEAAPLIRQGLLVRVLADWHLEEAPVLALVPSRSGTSARIHRFLEHAKQALKSVPWRK